LSKAFPSSGQIFPIPSLLIPIGLIAGLLTGMTLGFLMEFLDQTFKSPEDVAKYAKLPVLLYIPLMQEPDEVKPDKGVFSSIKEKLWPSGNKHSLKMKLGPSYKSYMRNT
ncbi:MAG: hypothetical protein L7F77_00050, partial [Candidatus Magnetominusculus sp. LBB02]|nr:hypothetical protein [Candidatus Magnetominusculus sp. LBB02]